MVASRPIANVDLLFGSTLEELQRAIATHVQDSGRAGYIVRSASHAVDPAAPETERYSALIYTSRLLRSDMQVVTPEEIAAGRRAVGLPVED